MENDGIRCAVNATMSPEMPYAVNYHKWVFSSFERYLKNNAATLEIGAGHSGYTRLLRSISNRVIASDMDRNVVDSLTREFEAVQGIEVIQMDGIEENKLRTHVDNIVAINILEHIEDDMAFIKKSHSALNKGGVFVIFVPAFPLLFSIMDKQAGHCRRYRKRQLEHALTKNGFTVIHSQYFNFIGFWGWLLNKISGSGLNSNAVGLQIMLFDKLAWMFKKAEKLTFICGQSIILIGEKKP
ncbi:MAG: methyltransferase domain-containing protein [Nitrospirae bacterium]|nr:methyltransferase domain-containing protein [Nitrospirota bacterium]